MIHPITYHTEALKLMGIPAVLSMKRLELIEEMERKFKRKLPSSFRELYAVEGVEEWFEQHNWDQLVPLQRLELETRKFWEEELQLKFLDIPVNMTADEGIPIFIECQGCWTWWVLLTGSNDPPVIVESLEDDAQILACERLSDFIFANVWDRAIRGNLITGTYEQEQKFLCYLRTHFDEKPATRLTATVNRYRFGFQDCKMLLWDETCQFFLSADSEETQEKVLRLIEPFVKLDHR
ncbi:hypothetical protein [Thermoflavimicrobium dichotomicum]|uniref:SMI1 / KNR4 family (SUKH-1) n=1 Tax=Thermoflavimicrobium dichotomicum TaxID=46223 RepID=A0A1I3S649_9BACL|nr:hypothetical protein [Thermoflavimicrobium dichotomicum]SFJ54323.1 hypothetical protein SAMN05421852_11240 [Thermoflavimicrobium dichotomicum]